VQNDADSLLLPEQCLGDDAARFPKHQHDEHCEPPPRCTRESRSRRRTCALPHHVSNGVVHYLHEWCASWRVRSQYPRGARCAVAERSVTRAAFPIGITQSAASHALARLRKLTGDELLVRGRGGMVPTLRAEAMGPPLRRALEDIRGTLSSQRAFDPKTARFGFHRHERLCGAGAPPRRHGGLVRDAPGVQLRVLTLKEGSASELASGKLDVALMPPLPSEEGPGIRSRPDTGRAVRLHRASRTSAREEAGADLVALRRSLARTHLAVGDGGRIRGRRARSARATAECRGRGPARDGGTPSRRIERLLLTIPERIARVLAPPLSLVVLTPPPELGLTGFTMSMLWHERTHDDPARRWVRDVHHRRGEQALREGIAPGPAPSPALSPGISTAGGPHPGSQRVRHDHGGGTAAPRRTRGSRQADVDVQGHLPLRRGPRPGRPGQPPPRASPRTLRISSSRTSVYPMRHGLAADGRRAG